jgi:hypothetical protein
MTNIVLSGPRLYVYINSYGSEAEKERARECIRQYIANIRDNKKREEYRAEIEANRNGKAIIQMIEDACDDHQKDSGHQKDSDHHRADKK